MAEYICKDKALNLDFKINVSLFENRRKTAERAVQAYADAISAIPAADVRPVVRGRWEWDVLDGTPGYRPVVLCCSNCHRVSFSGWDFCPNCGADMREES